MDQYLAFLNQIMTRGEDRPDRTGTGVRSIFSHEMRFDISKDFPLLTTKYVHFSAVMYELFWILSGNTNIQYLNDNNVNIWNAWADNEGNLGPVYGQQWRSWKTHHNQSIDQIQAVIQSIKENPYSRRHIVSAWNVSQLEEMALPPCHLLFQFYVGIDRTLSCKLYQRSADAFLGVPFNIASYSLLTYMIASLCDLTPKEFIWSGADCHIYHNHFDAVATQQARTPLKPPSIEIQSADSIDAFTPKHITLLNYKYHKKISAPISV